MHASIGHETRRVDRMANLLGNRSLRRSLWVALALSLVAPVVGAAEREDGVGNAEASAVVTRFLEAGKRKDWSEARSLIHPEVLRLLSDGKGRPLREVALLALWETESSRGGLIRFQVVGVRPGPQGTYRIEVLEERRRAGDSRESTHFVVGRKAGRWWVLAAATDAPLSDDAVRSKYGALLDAFDSARDEED